MVVIFGPFKVEDLAKVKFVEQIVDNHAKVTQDLFEPSVNQL